MLVQANPDLVAFVDITTEGTPKPPTNVVAESPIHGYDVNLTWEDPTEDLAGNAILIDSIVIYRNEDRIASVNAGIQYFHDTEAYYSRVLTYSLVAWSDGNKSILASSNSIAPSSIFFDNFNSDLSKWEITNNGICPWELLPANFYQLPSTATGYCLAADADDCGSGTNINTIATMIDFIDLRPYGDHAYLYMEFDSDWEALDEDDYGYVEISSNGTDWEPILVYNSVDVRNEHVEIYITHSMGYVPKLKIRFRTVMPGWDWHWAIDNVIIDISYYPSSEPRNLVAIAHQHPYLHVVLTWDEYNRNQEGFEIYRRESGSEKKEDYNLIGFAELNATTFTDTSVLPLKEYEYRIRAKLLGGINYSYYSFPTTVITPIPVELTSFEAQAAKAGVFLKWSTATETNNSGFDVEKSINNSDFISIGFVEGMGTRTEITNYSFEDKSVSTGTVYYRLKQIDFDGSFEYSNTIEVDLNVILEYSLEQNYPNPFNPATKINYQIPEDGFVQLIIYDVLGNEVAVLVNEKKIPGIYEVDFDASNITSGVYLYSLRVNHFVQTNKMVILK
ncbi:MAG: T9SS type A sorting domain-containing protein [Ignavibacteriae bacterium]|nr:T9SS C-terminal target domain-containing protein [Ignavibacteriota bacterium]NOG96360.1 T9SS type A sorting domain-containing protein [Ignavibacteriota bacterium]